MNIRLIMAASLAVTLVSSTAVGETSTFKERHARFQLFSDCGPMQIFVEELDEDAANIGLTEGPILAAAESRLRSARLYSTEADQYLYINVNVVDVAFSARLEFNKVVSDPLSGERLYATTWNIGSFGTHAGDSGFILSDISQHLDKFLVEFLRVNEEACGKR